MSQEDIVRHLAQLLRALDGEGLLSGPCNFMSRVVETMLEVGRTGLNNTGRNNAFVSSEYESDIESVSNHKSEIKSSFYESRQELLTIAANLTAFLYQYIKIKPPKSYKRSFSTKLLSDGDKKQYLEYCWCLCYLDALHSRFCCYSLNLYIIFLQSFKETTALLEYTKDIINIISARDKHDTSFKKEIGKVALKLFKHHLVPQTTSKSSFVVKFTTTIMHEYFHQTPSITHENMFKSFTKMKVLPLSSSFLKHHYFHYNNADFMKSIVNSIEEKLIDVGSFYTPFYGLYENNAEFQKIIDTFKNTLTASSLSGYSISLNIEHFKLGNKVLKVLKIENKQRYHFFKELEYLKNIKDPYNIIVYPSNYTSSDYIDKHMLLFYENIQYTLEEIMFDSSSKRRYLFNEYEILVIVFEVVKGVMFMHNNAITHSDLTLDNIVIVNNKIQLICANNVTDLNSKLLLKSAFKPTFERVSSSYDLFSIGMLIYFLLHSKTEVEAIVAEFINLKELTVIPSDSEVHFKWTQNMAKGLRPNIDDDHFVVDRPLRIDLVSKLNSLWHERCVKRIESAALFAELNEYINDYLETREEMTKVLEFVVNSVQTGDVENKAANEHFRKQNLAKNRQSIKKFRSVNNVHNLVPQTKSRLLESKHLSKDSAMKSSAKNIFKMRGRKGKTTKQMLRPLSHGSDVSHVSRVNRLTQDMSASRTSRGSRREGSRRDNTGRSVLYRIRKRKVTVEKKKSLSELELDDIQEVVKKYSHEEPYKNLLEEFEQEETERHSRTIRSRNPSDEYLQEVFDDVESDQAKQNNTAPKILRLGKKKRGSFTKGFFTKKPDSSES